MERGRRVLSLRRENERIIQGLIQCLSFLYVYSVIPKKRQDKGEEDSGA